MTVITFDTHQFVQRLKATGIVEQQAEAITEIIKDAQASAELATKGDITLVRQEVELLRRDMREMELRLMHSLTLRMGGMLAAGMTIVTALVKLL